MQGSRQQHSLAPPVPGHLCALVQYGNDVTCTRSWQLSIVSTQDMPSTASGDAERNKTRKKKVDTSQRSKWEPPMAATQS